MNSLGLEYLGGMLNNSPKGKYNPMRPKAQFPKVQFQRYAFDIQMWFEALRQIEKQMLPHRVELQRMYNNCLANPAVRAIVDARIELTLLRDYAIYQLKDGIKVYSRDLTQQLSNQSWFADYIKYIVEAKLFGYSLISLGEIENDSFPRLTIVPREHIRPDGDKYGDYETGPILVNMVYGIDGVHLEAGTKGYAPVENSDERIALFNHYVTTPTDIGQSECGYGLLFPVSYNEIHLRHMIEWMADYIEQFGMPIKVASTQKMGRDREQFEQFLENMGSGGAIIVDESTDKIEFVQQQNSGTGWKSYSQAIDYNEGVIAQLLLGHTDAIKSLPGKLGGMQSSNSNGYNVNLIQRAINNKQTLDGNHTCNYINNVSAPLFRKLGKFTGSRLIKNLLPPGYYFELTNDMEEMEFRLRKNSTLELASKSLKALSDAGLRADAQEMSDFIGFKVEYVDKQEEAGEPKFNPAIPQSEQTGDK